MKKGSYCLIIKLPQEKVIPVGTKPPVGFPGGYYCYVGSAMNGLERRICRHRSRHKKLHWHIDWFLNHASIISVKKIESNKKLECALSQELTRFSEKTIMKGFGSSDCHCETHLHYFKKNPGQKIDRLMKKMA